VIEPVPIDIREESTSTLPAYATVAMLVTVRTRLELTVADRGLGGLVLAERPVAAPYLKDYDADSEGGPLKWALEFDVTRWGVIAAFEGSRRIGGVVIAFDTPALTMLEGRRDLAVVWDIRVAAEFQGQGVGARLFRAAEDWAAARGCRQIKVETQNINVPACRFYLRMGCSLGTINRFAYPSLPDEIQLVWHKDLIGR
jgi:GNAT superfamily N-acetyltransferase